MSEFIKHARMAVKALFTRRVTVDCDGIDYHFSEVPLKKIINGIKVELSALFKPQKAWGKPIHLQIEPTAKCNLRCVLCPVTSGLTRPDQHMRFDTFKKVMDEVGDSVFLLLMWDWGEPFLNPAIFEMIRYAKHKGVKVVSSTNGHVFANKENAEKLVRSGIDSIIFAIDGIQQSSYEKYRQGGDLEVALAGIDNVVAAKRALGFSTPLVNFRFIAMHHNESELPRLEAFAQKHGVDVLSIKTLNPTCNRDAGSAVFYDDPQFIPRDPFYQRFVYKNGYARVQLKRNPCKQLWNNPVVHCNGNVVPCTFDPYERFVMGNIEKERFGDVWQSDKYRKLRRQSRINYRRIDICGHCTNTFQGGKMSRDTVPMVTRFSEASTR